jgi:peptidyl-prolyl cis-trans isomerase A (cyclophilin A)
MTCCSRLLFILTLSALCQRSAIAGTLAQFRTVFGDIEVELYDQDKPVTVRNFIQYVQSGAYQNEFAHRLIPNFVLQGGGYTISNRFTTNWTVVPINTFPPITNEFSVGRRFSNVYGTVAMAKLGGNTNSATSQWYFNLADNSSLDAPDANDLFVVFGHAVHGTNVLNTFTRFQGFTGVSTTNVVVNAGSPFDNLPVLYITNSTVWDTNLVFIDISLLSVQVTKSNNQRQVSWNSVNGMPNVVEYTTNFPPSWKTLLSTNGNGNRITITDSTATNAYRFYRVRVPY